MATLMQSIAVYAIPVIFAITLHEAAHAYAARAFGDRTATMLGRLSLSPLKHIDPIGTVAVPLLILATSSLAGKPMMFGWAKPVPIDLRNVKNPKRDMLWIALAGPVANLAMAIGWALLYRLVFSSMTDGGNLGEASPFVHQVAQAGILVNLVLMALNLLPIPPLDGGRVLVSLLPGRAAYAVARLEPFGMWILIFLMISGLLGPLMQPLIALGGSLIYLLVF